MYNSLTVIKVAGYQQCKRCVMDTTDPDIQFDAQGVCNHCTKLIGIFKDPVYKEHFNEQALHKLVLKMKTAGRGKKYDCLLGISGGVDSSYLAYRLKQAGLRVLLVHMDNGWDTEIAVRNIKTVVDHLGFDYEAYVLDWEEFKDTQLAFLKASVVEAETPTDIAIQGAIHKIAAKHGIKYVVSGSNLVTEGILPYTWHYNAKDEKYLFAIQKQFGTKRLRKLPLFSFWQELWYKFIKNIRIVYPLNYIQFSKEEAIETLMQEMNWRKYSSKHYESRYTRFVQSYLLPQKFRIDYRKATFSSQICAGTMTRAEALVLLQQPIFKEEEIEQEKIYVAKKLGITGNELDNILALPPKSFHHYPNNQKKLEFYYRLYRKFFQSLWNNVPEKGSSALLYAAAVCM